ncbi:MAG: right-handed parallel beta-helix repeat-containing protein [Novosphingobium sp.]
MHKYLSRILVALVAIFMLQASPAMAQATRTWVSGVGDDVNPCSRTAPCKTFAGAISKTAAGGEINTLDPGGFGAVTITKSITIRAESGVAGVLVSGTNGIVINAGSADRVVLDGLDMEGLGTGLSGVNVLNGRDVIVRNSSIRNFTVAGITVNSASKVNLTVENTLISNNVIGVQVISSGLNSTARIYDSLLVSNPTAGVFVSGTGNKAEVSGNQMTVSAKCLSVASGGVISSYGDNVLCAGDAPVIVPKG